VTFIIAPGRSNRGNSAVLACWGYRQVYVLLNSSFRSLNPVLPHSPKFFLKLVYLDTLSALAHHVPLTQIDIPPAVYQ
jgi:hypothetical protein